MSNMRVTAVGRQRFLDAVTGYASPPVQRIHLFKSAYTPTESSVTADYTAIEANYTGYVAPLAGTWAAASAAAPRYVSSPTAPLVFTMGTPGTTNNIYGAYATDDADGAVLWGEAFDGAPYPMFLAGDSITYTPQISERSEFA